MKNLKYNLVLALPLLTSFNALSQKIVYPKASFVAVAAKSALEYGNSTITGVAWFAPRNGYGIKNSSKMQMAKNVQVDLFPLTPYIDEWYDLMRKPSWGAKKVIKMSDEVYAIKVYANTDADGNFSFSRIKPGKYLLTTSMHWETTYYYNGQDAGSNHSQRTFVKIVEIKTDGETVKVKLTN